MRADRKLVLRRETLAELTTDELRAARGGAAWTPWCYSVIEPTGCVSQLISCDGARPDPL